MRNILLKNKIVLPVLAMAFAIAGAFLSFSYHINAFGATQTQSYAPIVALVSFKGQENALTLENSADIQAVFNAETPGQTDGNSLQSYLFTISRGRVNYESTFFAVTLPKTAEEYRAPSGSAVAPLFTDALLALEPVVSGSDGDFDGDGDGALDGLTLYVNAESTKDSTDTFWPHQATHGAAKKLAGLDVSKYMVIPTGIADTPESSFLQVVCHETLHMFGADDLYHYSYKLPGYSENGKGFDELYPVGVWDLMGNAFGYSEPVSVNTYYRYKTGLIENDAFVTAVPGERYPIASSLSQEGIIGLKFGERKIGGQDEFFVLERRDLSVSYDRAYRDVPFVRPGYTVYRVRTLTDGKGGDLSTGNRLKANGDEIVYFDQNQSCDLSLRSSANFGAAFDEGAVLGALSYSDGSTCDLSLTLSDGGASVEKIVQPFRLSVAYGGAALGEELLTVRADGEVLAPAEGVYAAARGSEITVSAEGYVIPDGSFVLTPETDSVSLAAYREKVFTFSCGGKEIAGVAGTVSGTERSYASGEDGAMHALLSEGETIVFAAHGYSFSVGACTFDGDLSQVSVVLETQLRIITVTFSGGAEVTGTVLVSVNGGEAVEATVEHNAVRLENVKNGDRITFSREGLELGEVLVTHLTADGDFSCRAENSLLRLPAYYLAAPAVLFLIIAICLVAHDYRHKRKK